VVIAAMQLRVSQRDCPASVGRRDHIVEATQRARKPSTTLRGSSMTAPWRRTTELNTDTRPGRYVLTGSTRYSVLPQAAQSLTGRAHVINVLPLSQGELHGRRETFIGRLRADPARLPAMPSSPVTRDEYVDRILAGGFPMTLQRLTARARTSWFADYVNLVVMRDVLDIARVRQREALPGCSASSRRRPARC
jgi:hypothetical protein